MLIIIGILILWPLGILSTLEVTKLLKEKYADKYNELIDKLAVTEEEMAKWQDIVDKMYKPEDKELGIFLQQDGYMDKEQLLVKDLSEEDLPLCQKWSWDRILRSCFINKQTFYKVYTS